jgi:hypothetical protein
MAQSGVDFRRGLRIFLFYTVSRPALGSTQPPIKLVQGALSLGIKRPGHKSDHSPQRMREAIPPLTQYVLMALCLVKHRDNFTYTFYKVHEN